MQRITDKRLVNVALTGELHDKLTNLSQKTTYSMSEIIRQALYRFFEGMETKDKQTKENILALKGLGHDR